MTELISLCYRCEHRARFLETGERPRYQCKTDGAAWSCYMYKPVKPLIMARNKGDRRPMFSGIAFSARSHAIGIAKGEYQVIKQGKGKAIFYMPKSSAK